LSDAAAYTVTVPGATGAADAAALDDAALAGFELNAAEPAAADDAAALVVDEAGLLLFELQPTSRVATHTAAAAPPAPR
jgi:hypothetical protein